MKQTIFMAAMTAIGTLGVFVIGPFAGVAVYYLFAVLRPQYLWRWALPEGIGWSGYVAWTTIIGTVGYMLAHPGTDGERRNGLVFGHKAFLVFGIWITVTYAMALNRDVAYEWWVEYIKLFTMFGVASVVVTTTRRIWIIYAIATVALIYIAYELNFLYFTAGRVEIYRNGYGGLDNNGAALMLAMGIPLAVYAWEATSRWWRWGFVAGVPLLLHAVLMSYSRGAMISLVMAAPLLIGRSRRRWQFSAFAVAMAFLIPLLAGREIRDRFFTVNNYEADQSANSRFESWTAALHIANDYPIFGAGIRNSNLLSYRYGADMEGRTIHSQYLQTLADNGYPGLVLYVIALGSVWVALFRSRRLLRTRTDPEALQLRSLANGLEGSLLVFCVGGSFLSLEVFELPYLVSLLGIQLWTVAQMGVATQPTPVTEFAPSEAFLRAPQLNGIRP